MNPIIKIIFLVFISFSACKTPGLIAPNSAQASLEDHLQFLVVCLNNRDISCLENLYATDFASISPIMSINSSKDLVARTVDNYEKNRLSVQISVEEIKNGPQQGYSLVNWTMLQTNTSGQKEIFLQQKRMDIWRWNTNHGWQLYRTLFYDPMVR